MCGRLCKTGSWTVSGAYVYLTCVCVYTCVCTCVTVVQISVNVFFLSFHTCITFFHFAPNPPLIHLMFTCLSSLFPSLSLSGSFANTLPTYQRSEVMLFIMGKIPVPGVHPALPSTGSGSVTHKSHKHMSNTCSLCTACVQDTHAHKTECCM